MRTINSPGTTGNKEAVKHNDKIMNKIGTFNMPHSPLNKNEFDIDYSGAEPVDLGNIPASNFTKAKKKLVDDYGGANNPEYQMEKGAYFYDKEKDKMRSSYLEYPEDAEGVDERYLGKNWDNSPLNVDPFAEKKFDASRYKEVAAKKEFYDQKELEKQEIPSPYEADKTPRIKKKKSRTMVKNISQKTLLDKIASPLDCWDGYERVPGTKEFSKGSCRKK